jgi:hypothetical protein
MKTILKVILSEVMMMSCFQNLLAADVMSDFSETKWDKSAWKYLKVWPYKPQASGYKPEIVPFTQEKDCVSVDWSKDRVAAGDDNTVMVTDCLKASGEIVMEFEADGGRVTAPGICLFPAYGDDRVLEKGIAVFVASYTMAVWQIKHDETGKITRYKLLGMTVKWFDPSKRHVLRCRFGGNDVAVSVDGSDPAYYWLQPWFPPMKDAGKSEDVVKPNAKAGIWGCHGKCKFYSFTVLDKPTLPLAAEKPAGN